MGRKKDRGKGDQQMELNITSMMDMFTIILVFLLKSYSTEAETKIDPSEKLQLPVTESSLALDEDAPAVVIAKDAIYVGTTDKASDLVNWEPTDTSKDSPFLIPKLKDLLDDVAEKQKFIAENTAGKEFTGVIIIQADRDMPSTLLTKVMYTVGQAEYSKIKLAAISKGE